MPHPAWTEDGQYEGDGSLGEENTPLPPGTCCLFSESIENFRFICTFGGLSVLMLLVSAFAFLLVSKEEESIDISYFYVWLPLLIFASIVCCGATCLACCLLGDLEDEDEQEATRRRDKASGVCVGIFCIVVPLFITIQFGMSFTVAYQTPVLLFIPQIMFPGLVFLGVTLVMCFSDLDGLDRLITIVLWLFTTAWILTLMFIPLKIMHALPWSWWKAVAPSYLLDAFIFLATVSGMKKAQRDGRGRRCASFLSLFLFWSALFATKIIGITTVAPLWLIYAPVSLIGPFCAVLVPMLCLVQLCSRRRFYKRLKTEERNRSAWEESKLVLDRAVRSMKFDSDDDEFPDGGGDTYYESLEDGRQNVENGNAKRTAVKPNSSAYLDAGGEGSMQRPLLLPAGTPKVKVVDPHEEYDHGKLRFESASSKEDLVSAIVDLRVLVQQHAKTLRTKRYKQELIFAGQLKKKTSQSWDNSVANQFGKLINSFSKVHSEMDHLKYLGKDAWSAMKDLV
jgi:hypothetical protein